MKVACPSCNANLNIDDKKIPAGGARIKCPTCQQIFPVKPASAQATVVGSVPLPGATAKVPAVSSGAVPLPGITASKPQAQEWEEESTRVMPPEMIPGALTNAAPPSNIKTAAVPLPGVTAAMPAAVPPRAPAAVPLPGIQAKTVVDSRPAVKLPGLTAAKPQQTQWEDEKTRVGGEDEIAAAPPPQSFDFDPGMTNTGPVPSAARESSEASRARPGNGPVPLPGNYEPTRVGSMPASIPLPGATSQQTQVGPALGDVDFADDADIGSVDAPTTNHAAIPLPGNYAPTMTRDVRPVAAARAAGVGGAVPLPGGYKPAPAIALGGDDAVPLPGSYAPTGQHEAYEPGESTTGAVPLPGGQGAEDPFAAVSGGEDPMAAPDFDYGAPPPPTTVPAAPKFDFADLPSPKGVAPRAAPPPMPQVMAPPPPAPAPSKAIDFDFADLPSPRGAPAPAAPAPGPDFSDLPSPAGAPDPYAAPDFGSDLPMPATDNLPSPAEAAPDFSFDMAAPPPPSRAPVAAPPAPAAPAAPTGFGEVEFGDSGGGGDLEFDPTSAPRPADDLEADLSAPPVASKPAAAGDGLEMLSFIDQTAKEAGSKEGGPKARRFHIRRRSGKVFGPFEDAVIIKMLEDGQLLGNEEVSLDSENWSPIGGEPTFQDAITRLMEQPSKSATTSMPQLGEASQQSAASMDRLKNLYEGRMAAVAVVQGKEPVPFRKRVPYIVAGVLVLAIVATGGFLGTTPYGFFGLKVLFPAKVKAGSREFADLQAAKKSLLADTFKGYQQARDTAVSTLRVKEYPEARAIWCQSIFYLQRKYSAAQPAELAEARAQLENIELLGHKHPEVVKAYSGVALTDKLADDALTRLGDAIARSENADDVELAFLRAEAFVQKNQLPQARSELEAILKKKPDSARALHALGNLHQQQKEADLAAGRYEEALKADPEHASSAVELAAIELLIRKDLAKGQVAVEQALTEKNRDKLGPAELGKALALKAEALSMQHKPAEAIPLFQEALKADPTNPFTKARMAAAYVGLHDHEKALPLFKEASEASPESLEYAEAYLSSLIVLGKMEDATRVVAVSSNRFPANARLTYLKARVDDALDRSKEAEAAYLKAAAADPTLVDANLYLARLYVRFRRLTDAKPQLEEALKKAPDNADVRVVMGELALNENDLDRAEVELKKALELNPTLAEAYLGISRLELSKGRADMALEKVEKALEINPRVVGGRVQRGTALWKLGRLEEAVKELEAARLDEPRNTSIIVTLGAVQLEKKDLSGATGSLMAAIQAEPSNPEANFYMAKVKNLKAEHTGAVEHMKKALDLQPKRAEFRYWMGKIYLDAKKSQEAIDEWKLALELDPKYADALEALGHVFLDRNDTKKAVQYFQRALESDPNRTTVQAAIGDAYMAAEEWGQAIATYEKALKADPDLKLVYFKLGEAYKEVRKWDQAIAFYKKATAVEPDNAQIFLSLGYAFKERNQKGEAAQAFERYLAKRPDAENKKEIEDEIDYLKKDR